MGDWSAVRGLGRDDNGEILCLAVVVGVGGGDGHLVGSGYGEVSLVPGVRAACQDLQQSGGEQDAKQMPPTAALG